MSPVVVPVFISNLGCPHRCLFCDQRQFSSPLPPENLGAVVNNFIAGCKDADRRRRMIAFYGGTFTGLEKTLLESYLAAASDLVKRGKVHALKASTRPDMVDDQILERLVASGFEELELGAQSMDDKVLRQACRGHSAEDTRRAAGLVKKAGLRLGLQIMPGLPGETAAGFKATVDEILRLEPVNVRIYPTVVMAGTGLAKLYDQGRYRPLDLEEAVDRTLYAYVRFTSAGINVIRMGIPQADTLQVQAGPYHASLGYLVKSKGYQYLASEILARGKVLRVNPRNVQELIGYRRQNLDQLHFEYVADENVPENALLLDSAGEKTCLYFQDIINNIL